MSKKGEVKYSAAEKNNEKLLEIQKTIANIKEVNPHFQEFVKSLTKFCDQTKFWMDGGDATRTALVKVAGVRKYDEIAKSVRAVDGCFMELFKRRKDIMEGYRDNLVLKWGDDFARDRSVPDFEKSFKVKRTASLKKIKKAESNYAKASKPRAMKKAPEKAEETKKELEEAIHGHEEMLSQELHVIVLIERKRYAFFLRQISESLGDELKAMKVCMEAVEKCMEEVNPGMCSDMEDNFPEETKKLIGAQELMRSGSLHVVPSSSASSSSFILRGEKQSDSDSDEDDNNDSTNDSDGEKGEKDRGSKMRSNTVATSNGREDENKKRKQEPPTKSGSDNENKGKPKTPTKGGGKEKTKKKKEKKKKGSSDEEDTSPSSEGEVRHHHHNPPARMESIMPSPPPPPSSAVMMGSGGIATTPPLPFNGSQAQIVRASPRSEPRHEKLQPPPPPQQEGMMMVEGQQQEEEGEDLGSYLHRLDAPPPPPPVRDTGDMDDELAKILSTFG